MKDIPLLTEGANLSNGWGYKHFASSEARTNEHEPHSQCLSRSSSEYFS